MAHITSIIRETTGIVNFYDGVSLDQSTESVLGAVISGNDIDCSLSDGSTYSITVEDLTLVQLDPNDYAPYSPCVLASPTYVARQNEVIDWLVNRFPYYVTKSFADNLIADGAAAILTNTITNGDTTHAPDGNSVFDALALKLDANVAIVGATKTKITYDADGLVTGGADATTADIADSANKRYVTDAQLVVIGNTSGTNTGDQTSIVGITGTKAQFDTAVTDGNIMYDGDSITNATATAWRVFYADGSGVITELALGAAGTVLQSNGAASAPTFATPSGGLTIGQSIGLRMWALT